jgi:hypothetical protein
MESQMVLVVIWLVMIVHALNIHRADRREIKERGKFIRVNIVLPVLSFQLKRFKAL